MYHGAGNSDIPDTNRLSSSNPPIPPRIPLQPSGMTELPANQSEREKPHLSPTGGLPSSPPIAQARSLVLAPQNAYRDSTWGSNNQGRVASSQFGHTSIYGAAAPSYMESNPNSNFYGQPPYSQPYGSDPKTEYGPGVTVGGVGYVPPSASAQQPPAAALQDPTEKPRICGLRRSSFWLIFTVALLIIIGALVGGILGGAVFKKSSSKSSSSPDSLPSQTSQSQTTTVNSGGSTSSLTPSTTISTTTSTQTFLFALNTGTWDLSGERSLEQGTCIDESANNSTSNAVWACSKYQEYQVDVTTDSEYGYVLNGDQPTRFRALTPTPPTTGHMYWEFGLTYQQVPTAVPIKGECVVNVMMTFILGKDSKQPNDNWDFVVLATPQNDCTLANGLTSSKTKSCGCGYIPVGLFSRDLGMSPEH